MLDLRHESEGGGTSGSDGVAESYTYPDPHISHSQFFSEFSGFRLYNRFFSDLLC